MKQNITIGVSFERSYRSKNGNTTFVYHLNNPKPADLEAYKEIQGDYYRDDDNTKTPIWFTTKFIGKRGNIIVTTNGKIVPDMSQFDQAASLAKQYGGNLGTALANAAANTLMGTAPAPIAETPAIVNNAKGSEDIGDM